MPLTESRPIKLSYTLFISLLAIASLFLLGQGLVAASDRRQAVILQRVADAAPPLPTIAALNPPTRLASLAERPAHIQPTPQSAPIPAPVSGPDDVPLPRLRSASIHQPPPAPTVTPTFTPVPPTATPASLPPRSLTLPRVTTAPRVLPSRATPTLAPDLPAPNPPAPQPQPTAPPPPPAPATDTGPVAAIRPAILTLLAQREQAVRNLDVDSFINTVDLDLPNFRHEQLIWFDDLNSHPASYYALELQSLRLESDSRAVGVVMERYKVGGKQGNVSAEMVFTRRGEQWYYSDLDFQTLATAHFRIQFFASNRAVGNAMFNAANRTYAQITADLGSAPDGMLEVKLYPNEQLLQDSVMLSLPNWVGGWSTPGQSLKTAYNGAPTASYVNLMAHEFTHLVEANLGLNHSNSPDWLNEGLAVYEAERSSPDSYEVANRPAILHRALASNTFFAWASFPTFQQVAGGQVSLAYEQAYSGVQYLLEKYGRAKFNTMLGYLVAGNSLDEAFSQAFGVSLAQFNTDWRAWLAGKV